MGNIDPILKLDYYAIISGILIILIGFRELISLFGWYKNKFRIHTGAEDDKEDVSNRLSILEAHNTEQDANISKIADGIDKIDKRLLNMEIENIRKEILDMASGLSTTRKFNKDHYDRVFRSYSEYERILEENNMENGQVEISMQIIRDSYKEKVANGEFAEL